MTRVWDRRRQRLLDSLRGSGVVFSEQLIAWRAHKVVSLCRLDQLPSRLEPPPELEMKSVWATRVKAGPCLALSPNGGVLAVASGDALAVVRLRGQAQILWKGRPCEDEILQIAVSGARVALCFQNGRVAVLSVGGQPLREHAGNFCDVGFLPDGQLATLDRDGVLRLGDWEDRLRGPGYSFDLSPNGRFVLAAGPSGWETWSLLDDGWRKTHTYHRSWSEEGTVTIGDDGETACSGPYRLELPPRRAFSGATAVSFSPSGRFFAVGWAEGGLSVLERASGTEYHRTSGPSRVSSLAVVPGLLAVGWKEGNIRLYAMSGDW